jgi:hypothetical protein
MNISELVRHLEGIKAMHGDLPVKTMGADGHVRDADPEWIEARFMAILSTRERKPRYWTEYHSRDKDKKGEKVLAI